MQFRVKQIYLVCYTSTLMALNVFDNDPRMLFPLNPRSTKNITFFKNSTSNTYIMLVMLSNVVVTQHVADHFVMKIGFVP